MADLVGCVKEIGKCILTECIQPPVKRHIDYWWCFDNNIQGLRNEVGYLDKQIHDLKQEIEGARLRTELLSHWVEEWLNLASEKLAEGKRILQDDNTKAWNITSRYSMGKRAKKTAEEIAEIRNNGKLDRISDPAPPPSTRFSSHGSTMNFESRKHIEENIIQYLRSSSVSMVGICGMGGIGKTTMAERIGEKVKVENLFDEVVKVTVSQKIDMLKIQEEIAEWLELKLDGKHLATRAAKLRTRLMDAKRKIIILDDVWESLRFEDLGIPIDSNSERCKVLLTSRSRDSCKRIKNKKVFELKILKEEEAWILFKEQVGECVEDLGRLAIDVAAECKGLPIALVTVGLALQDETDERTWKYSLSKLKEAKPTDLPEEIMTHVYGSLELSYEKLGNHVEKRFFLLCCLFPEDYNIRLEELTWYCMGLQMFDNISIEEATNKTHTLVGKLKSRFLLIDGRDKLHVKMHDVVRDVAIYIGSKEKNGFLQSLTSIKKSSDDNCNWMSVNISNERMEVPVVFPKLRLLMLLKWGSNELSDISFEGMKGLNVLSFQSTWIGTLPPTLRSLKYLQTLCLVHCEVKNISVIGELTSLKIFSCNGCHNIAELPAEIRRLKDLRLLELCDCYDLQRIPLGVISSLRRLEELKMRRSFRRWEAEENGKERRNASLTELGSLLNLTCLEIEIHDPTLSAQEICLSQNLVKYYIRIGDVGSYSNYFFEERDYEKVMILNLPSDIGAVGKWIQKRVRNTERLYLEGDGSVSNNFNIAEIKNLRNLRVENCSTLKKLVETKDCKFGIVFPLLEILRLEGLGNLQEICDLNQNVSLCNLKFIHISQCSNLKHLFSVARTTVLQLEVLRIEDCESIEQVFWNEIRHYNTDGCIDFPKLKDLRLENLPNLIAFCQGLENIIIKFPNLTELKILYLPKLNSLSPLNSKDVSFCNLKSIDIYQCDNLRSLFSVSAARICLLQLEALYIENCDSMEQVFWNEGTDDNTDGCIEFPKLKELRLRDLPNLTAFCQGLENITIKFPNVTEMDIGGLPKLNSLSPLNSETVIWEDDQNTCFHFVCNPKVEIGPFKDLTIRGSKDINIRNIWCHQFPNNVFNNLETLRIYFMNSIRSLMSTSIAKNLVSLKYLEIMRCEEMVEVIESDDDNKQIVDINGLFPTLKDLSIELLPKLRWFWQWNHALELSLLETVNIKRCPVMETFTLGSINTPNRRKIKVNNKKIDNQKDLNDVIRHIWTEVSF